MDDFNNTPNPFNEDKNTVNPTNAAGNTGSPDPYNRQQNDGYDPYNQQPGQYGQQGQNPYAQYQQPQQPQYQQPYQQNGQPNYYAPQTPQGYPQQGWTAYQRPQPMGMAVASLVLGILSILTGLFMFSYPFLFLMPIVGLILGIVFKCKKYSVGKGMSTAGIITSAVGLAIPIALLIFVMVMLVTHGAELMNYIKQYSPEQYEELYELYKDQFPQWFSGIMSFFIK